MLPWFDLTFAYQRGARANEPIEDWMLDITTEPIPTEWGLPFTRISICNGGYLHAQSTIRMYIQSYLPTPAVMPGAERHGIMFDRRSHPRRSGISHPMDDAPVWLRA